MWGRGISAVALGSLALALLVAPASAAPTYTIASGMVPSSTGGFPWIYQAEARRIGKVPVVCTTLNWAWAPEEPLGNGGEACAGASSGGKFSLYVGRLNGLDVFTSAGTFGADRIRLVAITADRRVRRIRLTLHDGTKVALRARVAPRGLRKKLGARVRVAWYADQGEGLAKRARGLNRRGKRIASWRDQAAQQAR